MSGHAALPLIWLVLLIVAWPYTQRVQHPDSKPLAAYLVFVISFSAMAAVLFGMLTTLLMATGRVELLYQPLGVALFLIIVCVPSFLLARALIRRRPRRAPLPSE
jgi:hypothetical protein